MCKRACDASNKPYCVHDPTMENPMPRTITVTGRTIKVDSTAEPADELDRLTHDFFGEYTAAPANNPFHPAAENVTQKMQLIAKSRKQHAPGARLFPAPTPRSRSMADPASQLLAVKGASRSKCDAGQYKGSSEEEPRHREAGEWSRCASNHGQVKSIFNFSDIPYV
jgi:hypothetical protein